MACGDPLYKKEENICTHCRFHLPKTNFHLIRENPISKLFWGKVNIETATSFYYFNKGNKVQNLLHNFKYKGQSELGTHIGKMFGNDLAQSLFYKTVDLIVPIPLHPAKLKRRGYNQSDFLAKGLAESLDIGWDNEVLKRTVATSSQTQKSRFDRWKNVDSIFELNNSEAQANKHILLVDDVVTTGSTLESAANELLKIPGAKVSIATIAFAV